MCVAIPFSISDEPFSFFTSSLFASCVSPRQWIGGYSNHDTACPSASRALSFWPTESIHVCALHCSILHWCFWTFDRIIAGEPAIFTIKEESTVKDLESKIKIEVKGPGKPFQVKTRRIENSQILVEFTIYIAGRYSISVFIGELLQFELQNVTVHPGPVHIPSSKVAFPRQILNLGSTAVIYVCSPFHHFLTFKGYSFL